MITLKKEDEAADLTGVTKMGVGVSWDPTAGSDGKVLGWLNRKIGTDLDLIAILMRGTDPVRIAGLDSLDPLGNGSVVHSGDNQTGKGEGDDEMVNVIFENVSDPVTSIIFTASAFKKNSSFGNARNISFKVYDSTGGSATQVADIWPSLLSNGQNANAVAHAYRDGEAWKLKVLDVMGKVKQGDEQALMRWAAGFVNQK